MSKEAMIPMGDPRKLIGKFAIFSDSKLNNQTYNPRIRQIVAATDKTFTVDTYLFREKQDEPTEQGTIRISSSHIALFDTYKECYDAVSVLRKLYDDMAKTIKAAQEQHENNVLSTLENSSKMMIHVGLVDNK